MSDASTLIREARTGAGLSMRALAALVDVSFTTICRIEQDQVDPTTGTLRKLLGAVGEDLELGRRSALQSRQLASLADASSMDRSGQERPDWTRMRAFLDHMERPRSHRPGRALERHACVARPLLALRPSSPCEIS